MLAMRLQAQSYARLTDMLDGNDGITLPDILLPNALSWFYMWLSSLVIVRGLRQKVSMLGIRIHLVLCILAQVAVSLLKPSSHQEVSCIMSMPHTGAVAVQHMAAAEWMRPLL
jgi:hypothetical protein